MTDEPNLLPCPFCGGPAERVDIDEGENRGGSCICCTSCLASGNIEFEFKENFVANWNRRASAYRLHEPAATDGAAIANKFRDAAFVVKQLQDIRDARKAGPPPPAVADNIEARRGEPVAWLIREIRGGHVAIMAGWMFKRKEAADEAALRLTSRHRQCQTLPVYASQDDADALRAEDARLRKVTATLVHRADFVMRLLQENGGSIVPHLLDTDDNPGEFLRDAIVKARAVLKSGG